MKIHAYDKNITQMLSSEIRYIIPRFQREYSWTVEENGEFWNDIMDNIEETDQGYKNKEYFIGSLVLVEEDEYNYHIVDGQQRLTTITILFSAIIDQFVRIGEEGLAKGLYKYIEGVDLNADKFFKLVNENPKPFFQKSIQHITKEKMNPATEEEKRLSFSYQFFLKKLESLQKSSSNKGNYIENLKAIRNQVLSLKTIFISVNSMDEAYTIFETLNSKGISLTPTDLIKNDIFKILDDEHPVDDAKDKWKKIQSHTKSNNKDVNINTFIRHYWLSKYEFITQGRLYKSYKKLQIKKQQEAKALLDNLLVESAYYDVISHPDPQDWRQQEEKTIFRSIEALSIFRVTQPKTILLSLLAQRESGIMTLTQVKNYCRLLENFHFIFTAIASERGAGLESKYSTFARQIRGARNKRDCDQILQELSEYLVSKLPNYENFEQGFLDLQFVNGNTQNKRLIQYIFSKFELEMHATEELIIGNITLEHVTPQSLGGAEIGMIGNLLPLDKKINEIANRKRFRDKLAVFLTSNLKVVQEFIDDNAERQEWSTKDIIDRSKYLATRAFTRTWSI